jgi:hypothetical protein
MYYMGLVFFCTRLFIIPTQSLICNEMLPQGRGMFATPHRLPQLVPSILQQVQKFSVKLYTRELWRAVWGRISVVWVVTLPHHLYLGWGWGSGTNIKLRNNFPWCSNWKTRWHYRSGAALGVSNNLNQNILKMYTWCVHNTGSESNVFEYCMILIIFVILHWGIL